MATRQPREEHFAKLIRRTIEAPAWRALPTSAQALYPWLLLEWHGPQFNNNGKIQLSVRQASKCLGIGTEAASRAFHELQAKGFIVIRQLGCLGGDGTAKGPKFELTDLGMPGSDKAQGQKLYRDWKIGHDFAVLKSPAQNPMGRNGKTKSRHEKQDSAIMISMTPKRNAS